MDYRLLPLILAISSCLFAQLTIKPNPLAALPSAPGGHIDSIRAIGSNSWYNLGAPTGDPKWGRALGCAWGGRSIVFAPELRGGFRTGEGDHGYVKSNGFGQDDYWFYDINGNRWICIYPGTDVRGFNDSVANGALRVDSNGQAVDRSNQPIPGHLHIHAWGNLTYDTDLKKFIMIAGGSFGRYFMPGLTTIGTGITQLEAQGLNKSGPKFGPWAYNTLTGEFERELVTNSRSGVGSFPSTYYIASQKEYFQGGADGVSFFNPTTRTWRNVSSPGTGPSGYDFSGCVDAKHNRVYMGNNPNNFLYFDLNTQKWVRIANPMGYKFEFGSAYGALSYDSINDIVLIFDFTNTKSTYIFEPETNRWISAIPFPYEYKKVLKLNNAPFYDNELGVHFIYTASDSRDDGIMWAYKLRDRTIVEKEKKITSVELITEHSGLEPFLTEQLKIRQTYNGFASDTVNMFIGCILTSLNPEKATIDNAGIVKAHDTGSVKITLQKQGLLDTLILQINPSTATTDSLTLKPAVEGLFVGDTLALSCTGYFHKDGQSFSRILDTDVIWQSSNATSLSVTNGKLIGINAGESINITVTYAGKNTSMTINVWPKPDYIRRINFQCSTTPYKNGWLAASGAVYSYSLGYGWTILGDCRDDRNGTNYLLKTFATSSGQFRLNAPKGRYIIKTGMGDNVYGINSTYSIMYGTDTINIKRPGLPNGINIDTINIPDSNGAYFKVNGPINYLVMISDQGIDINQVAYDGNLIPNEIGGGSSQEISSVNVSSASLKILSNPFNPNCRLKVYIPKESEVTIAIYDINGNHIRSLIKNSSLNGTKEIIWNGCDDKGFKAAAGIYLIKMSHNNESRVLRAVMAR
ncbi:MAG: T9SS type A sorting domain-containing protein [Fibrobacteres bacterium]|nr:T9SS type A sorting domain-containing protein [Fibrobacterota bacterium]